MVKRMGGNILQVRRGGSIVAELHAELSLALCGSTQLGAEAEHGVQTAVANESKVLASDVRVVDGGVALVHEHKDVALELVGSSDGSLHERLENLTAGFGEGFTEGHLCSEVESIIRRISNVSGTVVDNHLGANDLVADEGTPFGDDVETLGTGREELVGDVSTDDLALVVVLIGLLVGLDPTGDTGEITRTTTLALEQEIVVGLARDGLTVGNTGLASDTIGLVLTPQALDVDLEMQLTHTGNDGLLALGIDVNTEGRILTLESVHGLTEVVGVAGSLGLDGQRHDGVGNEHGGHGVGETTVGKGITRGAVDTENGADLTGTDFGDILHLVGVHADDTGNSDLLVGARVEQVGTLVELTLVDTDVGELTVVVLLELEGETDKGERVVGNQLDGLFIVDLVQGGVLDLGGIGKIIADGVEHGLDTLIGKGRTHHDSGELAGTGGAADSILDLFVGGFLLLEVELSHIIVDISKLLDQGLTLLSGKSLERTGNLIGDADLGTTRTLKVPGLHLDKVDNALELVLGTNGDLNSGGGNLELGVDLFDSLPGVGTHTVHLVDKRDSGDIVTLHLTIDSNGLRLNTADSAENHDGTVEDAQSTLDLDGEVDMAGSINKVEVVGFLFSVLDLFPVAESSSRLNGDSLFSFQFHRVHLCAN